MKIDWGRVPENTLVEITYCDGRKGIRFFKSFDFDYIRASEYSNGEYCYEYCCQQCELVLPDDIEKYTIKEEPRYVCPVCGEEVEQKVDLTLSKSEIYGETNYGGIKVTLNEIHICENKNCGIVMSNKNGHFGKKVE